MTLQPVAWRSPSKPDWAPPYERNQRLAAAELWPIGVGPEDVAVDADGRVYAGLEDGRILRISEEGRVKEKLATTGGRPLGIEVDRDGSLVICDAREGLLRLRPDGRLETLVDSFEGKRLRFTNNAAIAGDGSIYFTDTSQHFGVEDYLLDLIEHSGTGRLFAHRPDGTTELLLDGLQFANGVALAPDESYVLVAETGSYRIQRYWLTGDTAGRTEVFVDNLPGFPDNMSEGDGIFWVALPTPRDAIFDAMASWPKLRRIYAALPQVLQRKPRKYGLVLGFDDDGQVVHNLQDPSGRVEFITGVRWHDGRLYLGSLTTQHVAVLKV